MISVFFFKKNNKIIGFKINGHSAFYKQIKYKLQNLFYKKRKLFNKKDYICSAVSSISYMTIIGLKEIQKKKIDFQINNSGFMECILKEPSDNNSEMVFKMFYTTLKEIDKEYPENITIKIDKLEEL